MNNIQHHTYGSQKPVIATMGEVNRALVEIARVEVALDVLAKRAREQIAAIRNEALEEERVFLARITELSDELRTFSEKHPAEFFNATRSLQLPAGTVGYRKNTTICVRENTLALMRKAGFHDCINVKESLNKEAMNNLSEKQLRDVEALRVEQDLFFCETNHEKIDDLDREYNGDLK